MTTALETLHRAAELLGDEQSSLRAERRRYEEFREAVRLAQPEQATDAGGGVSQTTGNLLETYRETVMATPDFDVVYGDTLEEHLEHELSPSIAEKLLAREPFTQRFKRNLLLATTAAIERRDRFVSELDVELETLQTTKEELAAIEADLESLPVCSLSDQPFEEFSQVWEAYGELERQCQRILTERQQEIVGSERRDQGLDYEHSFNEYLYDELDTSYPILSAATRMCDRVQNRRRSTASRRPA